MAHRGERRSPIAIPKPAPRRRPRAARRGVVADRRRAAAARLAPAAPTSSASRSRRRPRSARRPVGELAGIVRATERIWRRAHLTYDQVRLVAKRVRERLELVRPARAGAAVDRLSREGVERLIAAGYRAPAPRGLLVKTLYYSGARVAELVGVRVEDVFLAEAMVRLHGKGGRVRLVPIPPELAHELGTHLAGRRSGWLFETRSARPYSTRRIEQIVHEAAAAARLTQRVYPHLLRHTIAQHLLEGGMPVDQVQRFLGHVSPDTTQIYAQASLAMIRDGYGRALGVGGGWGRAELDERAAPSALARAGGRAPPPAPALRDSARRTAPPWRAAPATSRRSRRSRVQRA